MKFLKNLRVTLWATICLAVASCVGAQTTVPKQGTTTSSRQAKQLLDDSVLETVLSDLLQNPDFNEAAGKKQILLGSRTPSRPPMNDLGLMEAGKLTYSLPATVYADFRQRNSEVTRAPLTTALVPLATDLFDETPYNWNSFHPRNPQILVHDLTPYFSWIDGLTKFSEDYPDAKGYVVAWLPGYSPDQKTAMLHFMIGPNEHGCVGTYLLIKSGGKWKIKWRTIVHFA